MAHKCETLAQSLDEKSQAQVNPETRQVETDLKEAIANICGLGRTIFQHDPLRRKDYELAAKPVTRQQAQRFPHL
ncbi:MAG: hypothetical protein SF053_05130 [Bacteroidia bacterium]|nr:hypothetical protein [Bacteroidia bacterium]